MTRSKQNPAHWVFELAPQRKWAELWKDLREHNTREYALYLLAEELFTENVIDEPPVWDENAQEVWISDTMRVVACDGEQLKMLVYG